MSGDFRMGAWIVRPSLNTISKNGTDVQVEPKVMEVLVCLASRAGASMSKETIIKTVWPDTFVSDDALIRCVSELRRVFEDDVRAPAVIQTIPKRGYRLVASVEHSSPVTVSPGSPVGRKRNLWLGIAVGLVLIAAIAWGAYSYLSKPAPFQRIEISQLTSNGKVKTAAISPDGRYVGYVVDEGSGNPFLGLGGGGKESLWVRQAAGGNDVQVAPPSDADYKQLAFSHNGDFLYVIRSGRENPTSFLYKIPALGGTEKQLISDLDDVLTFSPDGKKIAFLRLVKPAHSDLVVANEDGSGERILAECKSPPFYCANGVAWSPNGKAIATNAFWGESGTGRMSPLEFSVQSGSEHSLANKRLAWLGNLVWLPDGRGLIVNAMDLNSTQPQIGFFSFSDRQLRRITTDTNEYVGVSITADSRTIATVQQKLSFDSWVTPVPNAAINSAKPVTSGGNSGEETWAPTGKIVFQKLMGPGEVNIWVMESDGSNARQLTADAGRINLFPHASADGRYIVFISERTGTAHLWRMDLDGNNPKQLTNSSEDYLWFGFDFTPDSKWVLYTKTGADGGLWKVSIEGGEPTRLNTSGVAYYPAVSPDGKMLAYYSKDLHDVEVMSLDGSTLTKRFNIAMGTIRWTPDSRSLQYVKNEGGVSNLWSQPLSGEPSKQITQFNSLLISNFDFSRDGKQLVMSRGTANRDVVLIRDVR